MRKVHFLISHSVGYCNNSDFALAPASESYHSFAYAASLRQAGKAFRYLIRFQFLPALPNLARS